MTYFKLDIPKLNESIYCYKKTKKECLDDANTIYRGLGYTESSWNDINAFAFIERTKSDKCKLVEYFNYLDNLYNEINQFKTNIDEICNDQGYKRNSITLKFDDSEIEECKRYLNSAISYLNDSLYYINISEFGSNFGYINTLYNLRSEIKSIKTSIYNMIQDINDFVSLINNEIYNSKFRMKRIRGYKFNLVKVNYNWKTVDLNGRK